MKDNRKGTKVQTLPIRVALCLMFMGSLMACILIVANLTAMKIWSAGGWPVDGGVILFPLTYILGDLLVEIYGRRIADRVVDCGFVIGAVTCITIAIVAWLPDYASADNADFAGIAGLASRVFIASLVSYWVGQRVNNLVFVKIRHATNEKSFGMRAIGSSLLAHLVDAVIFEPLAFFGRIPFGELIQQIGLAFIAGIALECLLYGITKYLAKRLKKYLGFDNGQLITKNATPPRGYVIMIRNMEFEIEKVMPNGLGRVGTIKTAHGEIKTPAFVAVGTRGYVRFLNAADLRAVGAQAMLSNGYHLRRQASAIAKTGGLASWSPADTCERAQLWQGPTITDSGGFQVMSLGSGLGKVVSMETERNVTNTAHKERLAHVSEKGVSFTDPFDGEPDFIGPEESMQIQCRIGADIHMAFDELTSLADTYEYNIEAMERTERWALRSLREHLKHRDDLGYRQNLYGVLQGGRWEDLRRQTARNLAKMEVDGVGFDGFGLGGAFLKEDLGEILRWCNEELPAEKPRHLLGLSHPDDILIGSEMGADTFDCVAPMREARHGKIYTRDGNLNLRQFRDSGKVLDAGCDCPTCREGWTLGALRAMWRSGDLEQKAKYCRLASAHNLRFIVRLTEEIRAAMLGGSFERYKTDFLRRYYGASA